MRWVLILLILAGAAEAKHPLPTKVDIPAGSFSPLFGLRPLQGSFDVPAFQIDVEPVTRAEFSAFLKAHGEWWKEKIPLIYIDTRYLAHWRSAVQYGGLKNSPVVEVSWYVANAFCEAKGGRLPSTLEWEYVAAASETEANALKKPEFNRKLLDWYVAPQGKPGQNRIGRQKKNFYGVSDLHGLVWEWTQDFNSFFVASDNRTDDDKSKDLFYCAGAEGTKDKENYAAFMRYALRRSLQAKYSTENLGFRCAYSKEKK